jgi:hypothetical protein
MPDGMEALFYPFPVWLALVPLVVPLIVAGVKLLNHGLPPTTYPFIAVLFGMCIVGFTAMVLNLPRALGLALGLGLGLAGIGVREVVDQFRQAIERQLREGGGLPR